MTRISKQMQRRNRSPKKRKPPLFKKTGPKKDKIPFKNHENLVNDSFTFIPKITTR